MKELRDQLWDFVYGLLDEAAEAQLRDRITSDRDVARAYARVKLQSELIGHAARANVDDRELPTLPPVEPNIAANRSHAFRSGALAVSLALSVALLIFAGARYWYPGSSLRGPAVAIALQQFERANPRLVVVGPPQLAQDSPNKVEVLVQQINGVALSLPVDASLADRAGQTVWHDSGVTDTNGMHWFELPQLLPSESYELTVAVAPEATPQDTSAAGPTQFSTWLSVDDHKENEVVAVHRVAGPDNVHFHRETRFYSEERKETDQVAAGGSAEMKTKAGLKSDNKFVQSLEADIGRVHIAVGRDSTGDTKEDFLAVAPENIAERDGSHLERVKDFSESKAEPSPYSHGNSAEDEASQTKPVAPPRANFDLAADGHSAESSPESAASTNAQGIGGGNALAREGKLSDQRQLVRQELSEQQKSLVPVGQVLVEAINANGASIENRLVDGQANEQTLYARIEDLRERQVIEPSFAGRVEAVLYDPAYAPPQKLAAASIDILPTIEPLTLAVHFDQLSYQPGDSASVEVQVTNASGEPSAAVLNVQVDTELPDGAQLQGSEQPVFTFVSAETSPPLVFDNASAQQQRVNESLANWLARRADEQRNAAVLMLGGSALGWVLLAIAGLRKWLPRAGVWLPVAGLLGLTTLLGFLRLPWHDELTVNRSNPVTPLISYGVQSEPPSPRVSQRELFRTSNEYLTRFADREVALTVVDGFKLPALDALAAVDESDRAPSDLASNQSTLLAMSEWASLAQPKQVTAAHYALRDQRMDTPTGQSEHFGVETGSGSRRFAGAPMAKTLATEKAAEVPKTADHAPVPRATASPSITGQGLPNRTISWHPLVTTNAQGVAIVKFVIPNEPHCHLVINAHSGQRLGSLRQPIPIAEQAPEDSP